MYKIVFAACFLLSGLCTKAADTTFTESPVSVTTYKGELKGTLVIPNAVNPPVVLIIAGSGPTDRNGNNFGMRSDHLQLLAYALAKSGIASMRYDKRGVAESAPAYINENELRFSNNIEDAKAFLTELKKDKRFSRVGVIGHSEGSLVGMGAAPGLADFFISIAGAGRNIGEVLRDQLNAQPAMIKDVAIPILDSLTVGQTVGNVNPMIAALFRPSVQPYLISWMQLDPQKLIGQLKTPILIIQGTNDIQVSVKDAELLSAANKKATLKLITNMNHMFRIIEGDRMVNMQSYGKYELPISGELVETLRMFILEQ